MQNPLARCKVGPAKRAISLLSRSRELEELVLRGGLFAGFACRCKEDEWAVQMVRVARGAEAGERSGLNDGLKAMANGNAGR